MACVSIVVPTYNRADVLPRTIESVRAQTYDDLELIIVDDGSTDETSAIVSNMDDDWIRYHRFDTNQGANAARNKGVELATGDYVSFLDSDDELHPLHVERVLETFENHDQLAGVYTARENCRGETSAGISTPGDGMITQEDVLSGSVAGGFTCSTFDKSVFEAVGDLDEDLQSLQDMDFFIRVLADHQIMGLDDVLATCYLGDGRISSDASRKLQGQQRILDKHGDKLTAGGRARLYYYCAFGLAHEGELQEARKYFKKTIQMSPRMWLAYVHYVAAFHKLSFDSLIASKEFAKRLLRT